MGVDSAFLKKGNRLLGMNVKCAMCGTKIEVFINAMSSAGEVRPFCGRCGAYVNIVPGE